MKTKILLIASAFLMALQVQAQAPEKFNYQGIARDNTGAPLANQALGLQISILDGTTAEYVETHTATTNDFGLYHIAIGDGTPTSGTMTGIDWSSGSKSIKVEIDPSGGTSYTDLGTTELLSVPYALYAASAPGGGGTALWTQTGSDISFSGGNVGIGTTSPGVKLHVTGGGEIARFEDGWVEFYNGGTDVGYIGHYSGNPGDVDFGTVGGNTGNLNLVTDLLPRLTIDKDGSVGVGNTNPSAILDISGDVSPSTKPWGINLQLTSITSGNDLVQLGAPSTASGYQFIEANNGTTNVFIVEDDGTIKTEGGLEVSKNSSASSSHITLTETGNDYGRIKFENSNPGRWVLAGLMDTAPETSLFNIYFNDGTTFGDILSVSGQGKVGINYLPTSTSLGEAALTIEKNNSTDHLSLFDDDSGTANDDKYSFWAATNLYLYYNGGVIGNFNSSSGVYSATSDRRLKENIQPAGELLDKVNKVNIMRYTYKKDSEGKSRIGYIAQSLEQQFPEFVNKPKEVEGREIKYYTVNYAGMSAVAIKAIQEQQKMIENLQTTLAKMQQRLAALEKE